MSTEQRENSHRSWRTEKLALLTQLAALVPKRTGTTGETKLFLLAYLEELVDFTPAELEAAIKRGRKVWKFFPRIPDLLEELKPTLRVTAEHAPFNFTKPTDHPDLADKIIRSSPMAVRAKEEGWLRSLWQHVCDMGRLPTDHEIQHIKHSGLEAERLVADFERDDDVLSRKIVSMWAAMRGREDRLGD